MSDEKDWVAGDRPGYTPLDTTWAELAKQLEKKRAASRRKDRRAAVIFGLLVVLAFAGTWWVVATA